MRKTFKYVLYDILRSRFVIGYTLLLLVMSISFFMFEADPGKGILSLLNINIMVIPLVSVIFSAIHFYNSYEFIELLAAQPIGRGTLFFSQFLGLSVSLGLAFLIGVGLPTLVFGGGPQGVSLIVSGLLLTLVFVSIAFLASVLTRDKAKGIGFSLAIWFYLCILYDGLMLTILVNLTDYPMETAALIMSSLNPADISRILVLTQLDISALMGITGVIFQKFFGSTWGIMVSYLLLIMWVILPTWFSFRIFSRKDL